MRIATMFTVGLLCAAVLGTARGQDGSASKTALQQRFGANHEEIMSKYGNDPVRLMRLELEQQLRATSAVDLARSIGVANGDYVGRSETEPNNFFDTADNINDVLAMAGPRANTQGKLIQATLDAGDVDVYRFTVDPDRMYYFASTHSYLSNGRDGLDVNMRLFHESDLDTTYVEDFLGITGNDQIKGDILGRNTDVRNGSGDFRLTGWTAPIDAATGEAVTGDYYLWVFNDKGNAGSYYLVAYSLPLTPLVEKAEPNQTFEEALLNPASTLPTDAVVRTYMAYNRDTVRVVVPGQPTQSNGTYSQLLARGDEDIDHFRIDAKANHTLVIETLPFFGWYRDNDGSIGPGGSRLEDPRIRLYNADYTTRLAESDDDAEVAMDGPNNIGSRIVWTTEEEGPLWLWMGAWASRTRDPGQNVDNRDPGRFAYDVYVHQYTNDLVEANSEPNDDAATAMGIAARTDTVLTGSFASASDADFFRVFLHEHKMYSILTTGTNVTSPIGIELYHESASADGTTSLSGDLLAGQNVSGVSGNDLRVGGFVPQESGAYLIKLTSGSAGDYQLAVYGAEIYPNRVAHEPDDEAFATAPIPVGVGSPRLDGMIFPAGDVDHYVFDGVAGQQVTIKLQSQAATFGLTDFAGVVELLDAGQNVLATGSAAAGAVSQLTHTLPAGGQYALRVRAQSTTGDDLGNHNVGLYSLNVGEPVREQEPNNTPENATVLLDGFVAASFTAGDVDWYRVPVKAGRIYHIRGANNDLEGAASVDLFLASDPATSVHDGSDWAGRYSSRNFKIQLLPTEDTEYLVRLEAPAALGGGNYEIHVKSNDITALTGAFEPNDAFEEAATIGLDGQVRRAMLYNADEANFAYDADYYRVDVTQAGMTLVCETLPFDGEFWSRDSDMYSRILDASGNIVASNDDSPVTLEDGTVVDDWHSKSSFPVTEAGTYYCVIGSQDFLDTDPPNHTDRDPTTGEYKFRISYLGTESEPNDDVASATVLAPGGRVSAALEAGDVDYFRMDLEPGMSYHVRTFRSGGMDSFEGTAMLVAGGAPETDITDGATGEWRTRNNGSNVKLNLVVDEPTTYYLRIGAPANLGEGSYEVLMKANAIEPLAAAGEPNNTFEQADAIGDHPADGAYREYMLYDANVEGYHDDLDYYRVTANAGDSLVAFTVPFDGPTWPRDFDAYLFLYGPDRSVVAENDDASVVLEDGTVFGDWHSKIGFKVETPGTYYFLVIGQDAHVAPMDPGESRWRDPARGEYKFVVQKFVGVGTEEEGALPEQYELGGNYPNPFNPTTAISYKMRETGKVTIEVFNVLGQRVATLVDQVQNAGVYTVRFDASTLSSGVYLYRMQAGSFVSTKTMLLVK